MDSAFAAYERGTELNEGLATYVEMRAGVRRAADLPPKEFWPAEVRRRAYATGPALASLLDRFKSDWPAAFASADHQTLDDALTAALGTGNACTLDIAAVTAAESQARADLGALAVERKRRLAAFNAKPGWRVVVEASGGEPLWPQGFDPLNVERVGAARVLNGRYLKQGDAAGHLEALDTESLTEGTGPHPLFQGVRHVELTGLAKPVVAETDRTVYVRVAGLTLEFAGAKVTHDGEVITVRAGS